MLYADDFMLHMKWLLSKYWDCRITLTLPIERCSRSGPTAANSKPSFWCRHDTIAVVPQSGRKKKSQNRHLTFKLQLKFFDLLISPVIVLFATCLRCVATHRNNLDSWPSSWGASKTPQLCHELPIKARRRCDDPAAPMLSHRWSAIRHPKSRTSFTQIYCVPHNIKGKVQEKKKRSNDLKRRCSACHPSPKRRFLDLDQRVPVELASTPKGEPKAKNIYIE